MVGSGPELKLARSRNAHTNETTGEYSALTNSDPRDEILETLASLPTNDTLGAKLSDETVNSAIVPTDAFTLPAVLCPSALSIPEASFIRASSIVEGSPLPASPVTSSRGLFDYVSHEPPVSLVCCDDVNFTCACFSALVCFAARTVPHLAWQFNTWF